MNPLEKIHVLDEIEKEIILCLQSAGELGENTVVSKLIPSVQRSRVTGTEQGKVVTEKCRNSNPAIY